MLPLIGLSGQTGFEMVSRPGEFHPKSLSEPYVRLSTHTAPIIPASRALLCSRVHPFRLSHAQNGITQPLRSSPIARIHHYYELFRPFIPLWYSDPCGSSAWISPFASACRFPSSVSKPVPRSRRLHTGHRLDSKQVCLSSRDDPYQGSLCILPLRPAPPA